MLLSKVDLFFVNHNLKCLHSCQLCILPEDGDSAVENAHHHGLSLQRALVRQTAMEELLHQEQEVPPSTRCAVHITSGHI